MTAKFDELIAKLKEIFQLDKPELDFGVYRIMHTREKEITDFLEKRLAEKVRKALAGNAAAEKIAALGGDDDAEASVYSHLLSFFSRYYDDGDFISKRRYKDGVYAIPYSGEEVKLHWANADQYYIKSGENFQNYDFTIDGGRKVHFKLVTAETAKDNIKDNEAVRCFVLWNPNSITDKMREERDEEGLPPLPESILEEKDGELYIYFQYLKFKKGTKQAEFTKKAIEKIAQKMGGELLAKYPIFAPAPTEKDKKRTVLEKHFTTYTEKNTSDYFIHKDLGGFLRRELDFYIKNEMMHLDDIQNIGAFKEIEKNLRQIQAVRTIAGELITFMAQLEDFQKKLWLKKKFVTQCDYCLTMDLVPEELRAEVLANKEQQKEWKKLGFPVGAAQSANRKKQGDLFVDNEREAVDARMVDTKFFDETFKAKLLASIPDIDEKCDGLLIHSDNFQALRFIQSRFAKKVSSVYIDPPYNADATCILYKNGYRHSSWNTLILDRLNLGRSLMKQSGILCATIDDYELYNLKQLLDVCFGAENFLANVPIRNNPSGRSTVAGFAICHEYGLFYSYDCKRSEIARSEHSAEQKARYDCIDENGRYFEWENLRKSSAGSYRQDRPKQFYPIYYSRTKNSVRVPKCEWNKHTVSYDVQDSLIGDEVELLPIDGQGRERVWSFGIDRVKNECAEIEIREKDGKIELYKKKYLQEKGIMPRTWWDKSEYSARDNGSRAIANFFGSNRWFDFPKAVEAVKDSLHVASIGTNGLALDYFGGSGTTAHAVIALNREDGGHRKYILVEMGDHFDTVLKPRIEKVVYSPDWKDGKPESDDKGISHCFKYLTLESYEDALNNIELQREGDLLSGAMADEYLLGYMLDVEAKGSIINTDDFRHPFDYQLKIAVDSSGASEKRKIDLVETFNYLIGLRVAQYVREIERGYAYLDGTLPNGEKAFVMWRDCEKVNDAALNKLLAKFSIKPGDTEYDVIYVNGDHAIANVSLGENAAGKVLKVRQIENEFLDKMFAETK